MSKKQVSRRSVMHAFGQYITYADHLAKIKLGEVEGDVSQFARACAFLQDEYRRKLGLHIARELDQGDNWAGADQYRGSNDE